MLVLADGDEGRRGCFVKRNVRRFEAQRAVVDEQVITFDRSVQMYVPGIESACRQTVYRRFGHLYLGKRGHHLLHVGSPVVHHRPSFVGPVDGLEESLPSEKVMASVLRPESKENDPPETVLVFDDIAVTGSLDLLCLGQAAEIGKYGVVRIGLIGTVDVTAPGYRDAVAILRSAFCDHQVIPAVLLVDMRCFRIASSVALP